MPAGRLAAGPRDHPNARRLTEASALRDSDARRTNCSAWMTKASFVKTDDRFRAVVLDQAAFSHLQISGMVGRLP